MTEHRSVPTGPRRYLRWPVRVALAVVGGILLLMASGLVYEKLAESRDLHRFSAPGRIVKINNRNAHVYVTGLGKPTVILEGGLGGPALQWNLVQKELEKSYQVVSYDRAGLGWSDPSDATRTSQQMVGELHDLLSAVGVGGPYIYVGHSLGGLNARLFAQDYRKDVVGIVLVASGSEYDISGMPPQYAQVERMNRQTDRTLTVLSRFGLLRIFQNSPLLGSFRNLFVRFPADLQQEVLAMTVLRPVYWQTASREWDAIDESRAEVAAAGSLGSLPLVVLSGSPDLSHLPRSFPVDKIRQSFKDIQEGLSRLSTNSVHVVCESCDHYIPMTNPKMVIDAIELLRKLIPSSEL